MAKWNKIQVGKICKSKIKGEPDYIKIDNDVTLKKGDSLKLESLSARIKGIDESVEKGRLSGDVAEKLKATISGLAFWEWTRFEIYKIEKLED